jgi:hypothetical protein
MKLILLIMKLVSAQQEYDLGLTRIWFMLNMKLIRLNVRLVWHNMKMFQLNRIWFLLNMKQILVQIKTDLGSIWNWFWLNIKLVLAQQETDFGSTRN